VLALAHALLELDGPSLPLVLHTHLYLSPLALELLEGLVSVYLVDFKFGNDACAARLSGARDYLATLRRNLLALDRATPLFVRHLLVPGHGECCARPVFEWLCSELPRASFHLLLGYQPTAATRGDPLLGRTLSRSEGEVPWLAGAGR
jgi:putative pyruvate formate lyase activating enzyme